MSKEKNTNKDNFLFKDNKSLKELFENIPEKFYQNFSLIVLLMMIFLVVEQTIVGLGDYNNVIWNKYKDVISG